jgi:putative cardiolipin synthase
MAFVVIATLLDPIQMNYRAPFLALMLFTVAGCATLSFDQPRETSHSILDVTDTRAGLAVSEWKAGRENQNGKESGFFPLQEGMDALGARLRLAEIAEKSIDLQYFLMKNDTAGAVLTQALLAAADRGVRVRFLLDDVFTTAPDRAFLLMHQHPNIQVRLFNPISRYGFKGVNYVGDFRQANRRMHNKSFTVDNSISIVGGRNIADEYFQLKHDSVFIDFDMLVIGPVVREVSKSFDQYWNHERALPIEHVAQNKKGETLDEIRSLISDQLEDIYKEVYADALSSELLQDLIANRRPYFPANARIMADSPDKLINRIDREHMRLANDLREVILSAEKEVFIITPYYVPGDRGVDLVRQLEQQGVRVVIVTNSLASNNHVPVHGAYSRYRKDVLQAGAELYETRLNAAREIPGNENGPDNLTMHTKAFLIDDRYLFVGSLNADPRSIEINAEMGLLIDSPELMERMTTGGEARLAAIAYEVKLNDRNKLEWHGLIDGKPVVRTKDPDTSLFRRFSAWFLKIVPESQL